jgi:ORF6N domain
VPHPSKDFVPDLSSRIVSARGQRVLLDSDLAALYGVSTMRFNEAVKRNEARFPADFSFRLSEQEVSDLISQFAISSLRPAKHGGRRKAPRVFTEHGAIMAATVLNSERAIQMSVYVVRAFVELKKSQDANVKVTRRLEALERSVSALDADTRRQFDQVYEAILNLMSSQPRKN